jgi:hypothetical protein
MPMHYQQIVAYSLADTASGYEPQILKTTLFSFTGAALLRHWLSIAPPKSHPTGGEWLGGPII